MTIIKLSGGQIIFGIKNISKETIVTTTLIATALLLSVVSATAIAFFEVNAGIAIGIIFIGCALLTFPRSTVWVTIIGGLVVAGLVELYLPTFQAVRWIFSLLSISLAVISMVQWLSKRNANSRRTDGSFVLGITLAFFVFSVILPVIVERLPIIDSVVGLKNYFQMWGLMLALAWLGYKSVDASRFIHFFGLLALVQMPFVLHQFLVLVPLRSSAADAAHNLVAVDIVAGTFGGNMTGGGRSPNLAVLSVIAITLFITQWKLELRGLKSTIVLSSLAFSPIILNEAKLALVLLPISMLFIFRATITQRPFAWLLGATTLIGILALVIVGYANLPGAASQESKSINSYIESSISYNLGDQGYGSSAVNRSTVYQFWFNEHLRTGDVIRAVIGHGPGFSNGASISKGDNPSSSRYAGYTIGLTGISSLLWDTGLLGTSLFLLVLIMAYRFAKNLQKHWEKTPQEATITTAKISIILLALSLLHNDYIAFDIGFQTMFTVIVGYFFAMDQSRIRDKN
jgi:hypothetical protein